jgi:hypothetical protein
VKVVNADTVTNECVCAVEDSSHAEGLNCVKDILVTILLSPSVTPRVPERSNIFYEALKIANDLRQKIRSDTVSVTEREKKLTS